MQIPLYEITIAHRQLTWGGGVGGGGRGATVRLYLLVRRHAGQTCGNFSNNQPGHQRPPGAAPAGESFLSTQSRIKRKNLLERGKWMLLMHRLKFQFATGEQINLNI
jgi:hypothetical protein